jgi:hypothetical protein
MGGDTITRVCQMPVAFQERGNISMIDLIRESGYLRDYQNVTEAAIDAFLRRHPELTSHWIQYSQDQRCSPAWYLVGPRDGHPDLRWTVGRHPSSPKKEWSFPDHIAACAFFIKQEAESLRSMCN